MSLGIRVCDNVRAYPRGDAQMQHPASVGNGQGLLCQGRGQRKRRVQEAVSRGDTYPHEVAASVSATMNQLSVPNPHRLVWQSKVGPLPWLQPYTDDAIKAYAKKGVKHMILVPIAFVNEHIETLHELDIEYCDEVAKEAGIKQIERAAAPNDHPTFIAAMADVVAKHINEGHSVSRQFLSRCPHCVSERCKSSKEFYKKLCNYKENEPELATSTV